MRNWSDISYLLEGNDKQKRCYRVITQLNVLNLLEEYSPVFVGTIPINIDIESSDIDIICCAYDFDQFLELVNSHYGTLNNFSCTINDDVCLINFVFKGFEIEIYAESKPVKEQNAYRHMLIEYRILKLANQDFHDKIIRLKERGYKTEPAFGYLLKLKEPYSELLDIGDLSDEKLLVFWRDVNHLLFND